MQRRSFGGLFSRLLNRVSIVVHLVSTCSNNARISGVSDSVDAAAGGKDISRWKALEAVSFQVHCGLLVIESKTFMLQYIGYKQQFSALSDDHCSYDQSSCILVADGYWEQTDDHSIFFEQRL